MAEKLEAKYAGGAALASRKVSYGEHDDPMEVCFARGWTDGLPVTPPGNPGSSCDTTLNSVTLPASSRISASIRVQVGHARFTNATTPSVIMRLTRAIETRLLILTPLQAA